jgi:hypothetical protein
MLATDVHEQAMKIPNEQAAKLFACVMIDPATFKEYNEHRQTLRVRGHKADVGLVWQFDGMTYPLDDQVRHGPLLPGEKLWVPLIVAQYGVRNTSVWEYETDEKGNRINRQDFLYGQPQPRLIIVEMRDPGDFARQMVMPTPVLAKCAFCDGDFPPEELAIHMAGDHGAELLAASKQRDPAKDELTRQKVRDWANRAGHTSTDQPDADESHESGGDEAA